MIEILCRAALAVAAIILFTRLNGLRSFSKMSSFDFALTIALGSVLASTILDRSMEIWVGLAAMAAIYLVQAAISLLRVHVGVVRRSVDNSPLLLVRHGKILPDNLNKGRITETDLFTHLRKADCLSLDQVAAVVLETTGDISVLKMRDGSSLDPRILDGVRGAEP